MTLDRLPTARPLVAALLLAGLATLTACGGGGGSTDSGSDSGSGTSNDSGSTSNSSTTTTPPVTTPATATLSGTAATGAAMDGATITVYDATGAQVGSTTADGAGSYTITLTAGAKAPFVLTAAREGDETLVSVQAESGSGTVNITPITHLIASRLSPTGDPAKLIDEVKSGTATITTSSVDASVTEITIALKPLLDATGTTSINPLKAAFTANGTGMDHLLDSVKVSVTPNGSTSNIEVAVRQKSAEDALPNAISFKSSDKPVALAPLTSSDLLGSGNSVLIADLVARITQCYALPLADRVQDGGTDAAAIKAPVCRALFSQDDPSAYKSNGFLIGQTGHYAGIFKAGAQGVVFDRPVYEFSRANGDLVFSYRWTDTVGNSETDTVVGRVEAGKLKLIGNQYDHDASVRPVVQRRVFLNSPDYSYLSTGYDLYVGNKTVNGQPTLNRVIITTPKGNKITLKPTTGLSYLAIVKADGNVSSTSQIRLAARYLNSATTGHPADKDGGSLVFAATPSTDAELESFNAQSLWKFEYFVAGNTGNVPDSTETRKTTARTPSLAELAPVVWPVLSDAQISSLTSDSAVNGYGTFTTAKSVSGIDWTVPAGAWTPLNLTAYGRAPTVNNVLGARFNDSVSFRSTARTTGLNCSRQSNTDLHCDATTPTKFAVGTTYNGVNLGGRNPRGVALGQFYALYKL